MLNGHDVQTRPREIKSFGNESNVLNTFMDHRNSTRPSIALPKWNEIIADSHRFDEYRSTQQSQYTIFFLFLIGYTVYFYLFTVVYHFFDRDHSLHRESFRESARRISIDIYENT